MTKNKVIFIDWSVFLHRAIFAWRNNKQIPATFTAFNMVFSCLKAVGIDDSDSVIFAMDSPLGSWRKQVDTNYKSNRKVFRAQFEDINWSKMFEEMDNKLNTVVSATPFEKVRVDYLEADDIIAYGVKYYSDRECVIISSDSDYEQLLVYPNVKLFSPLTKHYKFVKNPYSVLIKKIKREAADNLTSEILTKLDYDKRKQIVDLIHLPPDVEELVKDSLSRIAKKIGNMDEFPFSSLRNRLAEAYAGEHVVTYEQSMKRLERKEKKRKIKKKPARGRKFKSCPEYG